MDNLLEQLEPKTLWAYFLGLSAIPRGSKAEAAAIAWVVAEARQLGCEVELDAVSNVLIRKPAAPGQEGRPGVALQAHIDMVCEKNEGTVHDFAKDPIQVWRDGDCLKARGTTLGADNGIGVASALAALAAKDLAHGPLEVLITIDEETGLTGAANLRPGWLRSKYLLNLDSEEEGFLTIGCAGGVDTVASRRLTLGSSSAGFQPFRLKVSGLRGGHSGIDIHAGRGNAIRLLAQVLQPLAAEFGCELVSIKGGNKRNAIPREASAQIYLDPAKETAFREALAKHQAHWRAAFGSLEPSLSMSLEAGSGGQVMGAGDAKALVGLLLSGPHGVEAMSPDIQGLVQTSTNLGVVNTENGLVEVNFLSRSAIDASKYALAERIAAACALAGFEARHEGAYPGWKPEPRSSLVQRINEVNEEVYGKPMHILAIHAGLECGLIGEKYPEMEMASIGPDMWDVHTPDERVSIPSVASFWKLLRTLLERL